MKAMINSLLFVLVGIFVVIGVGIAHL